jgi:uncharacterized Ntn-hydrolase superfamily protein
MRQEPTMTLSITAFDERTATWGVAVVSSCVAVGASVPWGEANTGAIATQALANLSYGPRGLELLRTGMVAQDVLDALVRDDPLASQRQIGVVDAQGRAASHTGAACIAWAGHRTGPGLSVQGNLLSGPEVVDAMYETFSGDDEPHLGRRLVAGLRAGRAAGGDRRTSEAASLAPWRHDSAALRLWRAGAAYGGELDIAADLRVDDHPSPLDELGRLVEIHDLYYGRPSPDDLLALDDALIDEVTRALVPLGYAPADLGGFEAALYRWIGVNNLEERQVAGHLDQRVLRVLRDQVQTIG